MRCLTPSGNVPLLMRISVVSDCKFIITAAFAVVFVYIMKNFIIIAVIGNLISCLYNHITVAIVIISNKMHFLSLLFYCCF